MISVVIPTRGSGDFSKLVNLLDSLTKQTLPPQEAIVVIDYDVAKTPLAEKLSTIQSDFPINVLNQKGYGVCAARNFGVQKVSSDLLVVCDDDILFQQFDILERMVDEYQQAIRTVNGEAVLYPTILINNSNSIQTQGFTKYNWFFSRPVPKFGNEWKSKLRKNLGLDKLLHSKQEDRLQLTGNICLFTSKETLIHNQRDERFGFIYEDLEWSYRAYKNNVNLINSEVIEVEHRERKKDSLETAFLATPEQVYLKTKHRIWFSLKHAHGYQKILFYIGGFWISNLWTLAMILLYGKRKNKMMQSLRKGIGDGLALEG